MERSHIGLDSWLLALHLLKSSPRGISAHQLHRELGITYKSAWLMGCRIRHAMGQSPIAGKLPDVTDLKSSKLRLPEQSLEDSIADFLATGPRPMRSRKRKHGASASK